jgi:hypothetical protein
MTVKLMLKSETATIDLEELGFKITEFNSDDSNENARIHFTNPALDYNELGVVLTVLKFQLSEMSKTPTSLVCIGLGTEDVHFPIARYQLESVPSTNIISNFILTLTYHELDHEPLGITIDR